MKLALAKAHGSVAMGFSTGSEISVKGIEML
jgi:hypothetical protein